MKNIKKVNENILKKIKKKLIDKEITFSELRKNTSYKTDCGLRRALKTNQVKAIKDVSNFFNEDLAN